MQRYYMMGKLPAWFCFCSIVRCYMIRFLCNTDYALRNIFDLHKDKSLPVLAVIYELL